MYKLLYSRFAQKDAVRIKQTNLDGKCKAILEIIAKDPFATPPQFEKLVGDLKGFYSRRINIQHRIVYEVDTANKMIKVLRMWSHYE